LKTNKIKSPISVIDYNRPIDDISDIIKITEVDRYMLSSTELINDLVFDRDSLTLELKELDATIQEYKKTKKKFENLKPIKNVTFFLEAQKKKPISKEESVNSFEILPKINNNSTNESLQEIHKHNNYFVCKRKDIIHRLCLCKNFTCPNGKKKHISGKTNVYIDHLIIFNKKININLFINYRLSFKLLTIIERCYSTVYKPFNPL